MKPCAQSPWKDHRHEFKRLEWWSRTIIICKNCKQHAFFVEHDEWPHIFDFYRMYDGEMILY